MGLTKSSLWILASVGLMFYCEHSCRLSNSERKLLRSIFSIVGVVVYLRALLQMQLGSILHTLCFTIGAIWLFRGFEGERMQCAISISSSWLSSAAVEQHEPWTIRTGHQADEDLLGREGQQCTICLEEQMLGQTVRTLLCGHSYHEYCVRPWFETARSCPLCRRTVRHPATLRELISNSQRSRYVSHGVAIYQIVSE